MFEQGNIKLLHVDCMKHMKTIPDKYYDLAIVDPPYGINKGKDFGGKNWKVYEKKEWDAFPPPKEYFEELFRVSKNQIIWGANYYPQHLFPSMGWIFWDKGQDLTMSDGEIAFSSFNRALRRVIMNRCEISKGSFLIHPTQKPVKLYDWLLTNYCQPNMKVLDTHLGSGSSAIAAHYYGVEFVGCELDKEYYDNAVKRFELQTAQETLF